ncbi:MAG: hypothetical protein Q8877_02745 [Sweet potato little leaf phytoplasma]|nr:hypothetical protein [Sweet potato little leaf phytoplasma]
MIVTNDKYKNTSLIINKFNIIIRFNYFLNPYHPKYLCLGRNVVIMFFGAIQNKNY